MSAMVDELQSRVPFDDIQGLVEDLVTVLDEIIADFRRGTRYENVRKSDMRVFMKALRKPSTISDISRELGVTRQAVHSSAKRLVALKLVELVSPPGNARDKLVAVTERGKHARQTAVEQVEMLERRCASVIGSDALATFRKHLEALVLGLRAEQQARRLGSADQSVKK